MIPSQEHIKELYSSVSIPSTVNSYSMGIEYIQKWFLDKFAPNYFKTIYVDERHITDEYKNFDQIKSLKKMKPSLAIIPQFQFDYNRDMLDQSLSGIDTYHRKSKLDRSFFRDKEKNLYLGINMELLQINFTFKVRVSTRAQQLDLYKYMQMAFRIGSTQGEELDMDFHIPYSLMLQVANDSGFSIKDNIIEDPISFTNYLNTNSLIPILYKYRTINGKSEFFIRGKNLYTHISSQEQLSADDGEVENQLKSNYMIEMNIVLKIPAPKLYTYYSIYKHHLINSIESTGSEIGLFNISIPSIPDMNDKGWQDFVYTEWYEKNTGDEPLLIQFGELFKNNDIEKLINHTKDMHISPSIFIDFKLFNNGKEIEYEIDWDKEEIKTIEPVKDEITYINVYTDMKYMNEQLISLEGLYKNRIR